MSRRATEKAVYIKDNIAKTASLASLIVTQSDSSGNPTLTIQQSAVAAAGEKNAFIKISPRSYTGYPTSTLAQGVEPDGRSHVLEVVVEDQAADNKTESVWPLAEFSQLLKILTEQNFEVVLYIADNGAVPVEGDLVAANQVAVIRTDTRTVNSGD